MKQAPSLLYQRIQYSLRRFLRRALYKRGMSIQEETLKQMWDLSANIPRLYKTIFGWTIMYGHGSSMNAISTEVTDRDVEEMKKNGFIGEGNKLTNKILELVV